MIPSQVRLSLVWMKRVEVQRAQVAVINTITESKEFDKIRIAKLGTPSQPQKVIAVQHALKTDVQILWQHTPTKAMPSVWKDACRVQQV